MLSTLMNDMKSAMKSGQKLELVALRNLIGKLKAKQIDNGKDLTTDEYIKVIASAAKQLKDSIQQYKDGNREDLAKFCFDFLKTRSKLDLTGFDNLDIFSH